MATGPVNRAHNETEKVREVFLCDCLFFFFMLEGKKWGKSESALLEIVLGRLEIVTKAQERLIL